MKRELTESAAREQEAQQYLTFTLRGEMFAMSILSVREIIEFAPLTEIPLVPEFLRGVMNLRGAVVPVLDLCCRFERPPTEVSRKTCIVVVQIADAEGMRHEVGVLVDSVSAVLEIEPGEIEPAPGFGSDVRRDFIAAVARTAAGFVIILDMQRVLSMAELMALAARRDNAPAAIKAGGAAPLVEQGVTGRFTREGTSPPLTDRTEAERSSAREGQT